MDTKQAAAEHDAVSETLAEGLTLTDTQIAVRTGVALERVKFLTRALCCTTLPNGLHVRNVTQIGQRVPRWKAVER